MSFLPYAPSSPAYVQVLRGHDILKIRRLGGKFSWLTGHNDVVRQPSHEGEHETRHEEFYCDGSASYRVRKASHLNGFLMAFTRLTMWLYYCSIVRHEAGRRRWKGRRLVDWLCG